MIADALNAFAAASGRTWAHDRAKSVGASEIGQCLRRVWFSKRGQERDADANGDTWGYRVRGSTYEDAWFVPALRAYYGKRLRLAGDQQRSFFDEDSPLSATPDGLLRDLTADEQAAWNTSADSIVVECKSIGTFQPASLPRPEHEFQVQAQIGLVRQHGRYMPDTAVIVYTSAFDWSRISEHVVHFDPDVFERARARAREAMESLIPVPEGQDAGGRECRFCPYARTCGHTDLARDLRASVLSADAARPAA